MASIRVPVAGLYIDNLLFDNPVDALGVINTAPEADETGVLLDSSISFWVVSYNSATPLSAVTKVWVTVGTQVRTLAYDQAGGGFQAGWNGAGSAITLQQSPGSSVVDEAIFTIDPTTDFPSHSDIIVEVQAQCGTDTLYYYYTFTTQYAVAPRVDETLWINPRRCRLRFQERMQANAVAGGTHYLKMLSGSIEFVAPDKINVASITPTTEWIGYWIGTSGSAYPRNNGYHLITAIDATNKQFTVEVGDYPFKNDDGVDKDADGNVVRDRLLRATISSYRFEGRIADEEDVECAFEPVVTGLRAPYTIEIPEGAYADQYVMVDLHDDISLNRMYRLHLIKAINEYDDAADADSTYDFTAPSFGFPTDRVTVWDLMPPTDQQEDDEGEQQLRKMAVVLQDLLNVLWYRCDTLQTLWDPDKAPDSWIPYLLYTLGNPFRFPMDLLQQRRLASVLTTIYKRIGTAKIIEDTLAFFLGGTFIVRQFQTADWWVLGTSQLGTTAVLGPSTKYAKNCYEIISSLALTEEQRRIVREIATVLDPAYMHLIGIVEPGEESGTIYFWTLGSSALGYTTGLAP